MPKTVDVTLGGRAYVLSEKTMGVTIKWREALRASSVMRMFDSLDDALAQIAADVAALTGGGDNAAAAGVAGIRLATVAPAILQGLTHSIDDVIGLLYDYSPELKADEEWLLENAYDSEAIAAFIEVLKLNFPIWELWRLVTGPRALATNTNLPSVNGAGNGRKRNTAPSKAR
jgi:hypothetical protein